MRVPSSRARIAAAAAVATACAALAAVLVLASGDAPEPARSAAEAAPHRAPAADAPQEPQEVPSTRPPRPERIEWRRSRSLGTHSDGRLVRGVQLPASGKHFFTWDPIRRRSPDRAWRRWGNDRLVWMILSVLEDYARARPRAPRVAIGDLSRPHGGDFGIRYGPPGHASHQNGLDADLYYPRLDRRERAPRTVAQVDRALAQDLVDRFVRAGAQKVFVGPRTGLTGPHRVVHAIPNHDNHLHVRMAPPG